MSEIYCKITLSNRCAKTNDKKEKNENCIYNLNTKRCNKIKNPVPKKTAIVPKKAPIVSKEAPIVPKKAPIVPKKVPIVPKKALEFYLNQDSRSVEFTKISIRYFLKNAENATENMNKILEYLNISKVKTRNEKNAKIKEYIAKTLQNTIKLKINFNVAEFDFSPKIKFYFNEYESNSIHAITLLLLYFNIYEPVSKRKKALLCQKIQEKIPFDQKQIEKHFFQKYSKMSQTGLKKLNLKEIDNILNKLNILPVKVSRVIKCVMIDNMQKIREMKQETPYLVLDDEHVLFNTKPKRILYSIYNDFLTSSQNHQILIFLEKQGLVSLPIAYNNRRFINLVVLKKKNFPNHNFMQQQVDLIPKTPSNLQSSKPKQYTLSNEAFTELSKKMDKCIKSNHFGIAWIEKSLIELVPKENIMKNGKDVRMYHGTKVLHWKNIKTNGIKPIGGGALGNGFYFTPSVPKATHYLLRDKHTQEKDLTPVLIEIVIKNADKLMVGKYVIGKDNKYPIQTATFDSYFWQFIVRSKEIIKKHFRIVRVFKVNI